MSKKKEYIRSEEPVRFYLVGKDGRVHSNTLEELIEAGKIKVESSPQSQVKTNISKS